MMEICPVFCRTPADENAAVCNLQTAALIHFKSLRYFLVHAALQNRQLSEEDANAEKREFS